MSLNDWSTAPSAGAGKTNFKSGCADGFPEGYGPCTEAAHVAAHFWPCATRAGDCAIDMLASTTINDKDMATGNHRAFNLGDSSE
jgi:hypothetical protein